jgi:predicted Zn-dependent protease
MKTSIRLSLCLIGSIAFVPVINADTTFSAKTEVGYDTNPYRLNDKFSIENGTFFSYEFKAKHEIGKKIRIKAKVEKKIYSSSAKNADNQTISTGARYQVG